MRLVSTSMLLRTSLFVLALLVAPLTNVSAQCASTVTFNGQPRIGTQITMTITGSSQCHSCLWISKNPGPTQIGSIVIPIGVPLLNAIDYGQLPASGSITLPIQIPNDPNAIGLTLYFTNVSFPSATGPTLSNIMFSPSASLTITP